MFWSGLVASGGTRNVGFHFLRAAGEILSKKKKKKGGAEKGAKKRDPRGGGASNAAHLFSLSCNDP